MTSKIVVELGTYVHYVIEIVKIRKSTNIVIIIIITIDLDLCSSSDRISGIGLREADAKRIPPAKWKGLNLLGNILTRVREDSEAMEATEQEKEEETELPD